MSTRREGRRLRSWRIMNDPVTEKRRSWQRAEALRYRMRIICDVSESVSALRAALTLFSRAPPLCAKRVCVCSAECVHSRLIDFIDMKHIHHHIHFGCACVFACGKNIATYGSCRRSVFDLSQARRSVFACVLRGTFDVGHHNAQSLHV